MITRFATIPFGRLASQVWCTLMGLARTRTCGADGRPASNRLNLTAVVASHVGHVRRHNEDYFLVENLGAGSGQTRHGVAERRMAATGALLLVADGMGGPLAGEVASAMAAAIISARLREIWRTPDQRTPEHLSRCLGEAIAIANREIYGHASRDAQLKGMGTTTTTAVLLEDHLCVGHIGDSRAYLVRAGRVQRLTQDHSWIQHLLDTGALSPAEAAQSPHRNILLRALGPQPEVVVDVSEHSLQDGDVLVLCSDGLWSAVEEEEIAAVLSTEPKLAAACEALIDRANARGGRDNVTVLLARLALDSLDAAQDDGALLAVGGQSRIASAPGADDAAGEVRLP